VTQEAFLSDEFIRQLTAVGEVDIVVGVSTLNNLDTVRRVVDAILVGLVKYYPRERSVLINPDAGSKDGTTEAVQTASAPDFRALLASAPLRTMHVVSTHYPGLRGQTGALRMIFAAADLLGAKACAVISADIESVTPEWLDALVRPILKENRDFVAPVYQRRRFDGLLVKNLLDPLIGAAYGYRLEESVGRELALSGRLATHFLAQESLREDFPGLGPYVWMTTTAISGGYRVCQAFLGPRVTASRRSTLDVNTTIKEVAGTLFRCMELHESYWTSRQDCEDVPTFGFQPVLDLGPVRIDRKRMFQMFRSAADQLSSVLQKIVSAQTMQAIQQIAKMEESDFRFPDDLWAKTVNEFASSYHHSVINRDHLLQALTPLYRGRVSSYILENARAGPEDVERKLESLRHEYEALKPYLIERWRGRREVSHE
jgi:glucosylglycerate synthase